MTRSQFTPNYLAILALQTYGTSDQEDRIADRIDKVKKWLIKTPAKDTEDRFFRLRALKIAGAEEKVVRKSYELLQIQREDGGWAQAKDMNSDAYATGTALVALHEAGLGVGDKIYRRGLQYLLQSQLEDGSWQIKSRSKPFQKYFESGFPHKNDQFISIAASSWAATALALACPRKSDTAETNAPR